MSVELVSTKPRPEIERRCIRILADAIVLTDLPIAEIKVIYGNVERARDALSRILDRADGKDA